MSISVTVKRNDFKKIAAGLVPGVSAAVRSSAIAVSQGAKAHSRVATGAMRAGFYTRHAGPFESQVSNKVPYWIYHEYGTHKMAAQPMVTPAAEAERAGFYRAVGAALAGASIPVPMF